MSHVSNQPRPHISYPLFSKLAQLACSLALAVLIAPASFADSVAWLRDFNSAMQASQQSGRPVLIHFYSTHCPPCKALDHRAFEDRDLITALADQVIPVKINVDEQPDLRSKFQVQSWPTDVYLFPNGSELYRTISPQDPKAYRQMIGRVAMRNRDWVLEQNSVAAAQERRQANYLARSTSNNPQSNLPSPETRPAEFAANQFAPRKTPAQLTQYPTPVADDSIASQPRSNSPANEAVESLVAADLANTNQVPTESKSDAPQAINRYRQRNTQANAASQAMVNPYNYESAPPTPNMSRRPGSMQPTAQSNPALQSPVMEAPVMQAPSMQAPGFQSPNLQATLTQNPQTANTPAMLTSQPSPGRSQPNAAAPTTDPNANPDPAIVFDGCCPIALASDSPRWTPGSPRFAVRHRGRVYYCESEEARTQFLTNPDRYSPVFSGYDIIKFMRFGSIVEGSRQFGCWYNDRIYLFSDQETYDAFLAVKEKVSADFDQLQNGGRVAEGQSNAVKR